MQSVWPLCDLATTNGNPDIEIIDGHVHAIERPGPGADIDFNLIQAKTAVRRA